MYQYCCQIPAIIKASTNNKIDFQAGLNCGIIATGVLSQIKSKKSLVGDTINVSCRLCFNAELNSICMSQNVFKHFVVKDAIPTKIKVYIN